MQILLVFEKRWWLYIPPSIHLKLRVFYTQFIEVFGTTVVKIPCVIPYKIYGLALLILSPCVCWEVRNESLYIT